MTLDKTGDLFAFADPEGGFEPSARDVNRVLRAEREREKELSRQKQRGTAKYERLAREAARKYAGNPKKAWTEMRRLMDVPAALGRVRIVSEKRMANINQVMEMSLDQLQELRRPVASILDIDQKRVCELLKLWYDHKIQESTILERVSCLRRVMYLIGKAQVIPKGKAWERIKKEHGVPVPLKGRSIIAQFAKGWHDLGVDSASVIAAAAAEDAVCGVQMEMMLLWGLRLNEAVQLQPRVSFDHGGQFLLVHRGTKGGKTRQVRLSPDDAVRARQLEVLGRAFELADKHPKGILAIPGLRLDQMKRRLLGLASKHGVNKAALGVTLHGLRHQFANDLFKVLTGLPAPCLGQLPAEAYSSGPKAGVVRDAYLEISRQMGHERPSISGAYLGSAHLLSKDQKKRLERWDALFQKLEPDFLAAGVLEAWITGQAADGNELPAGKVLDVVVQLDGAGAAGVSESARLSALKEAIQRVISGRANVTSASGLRPEGGFEVFLRSAVESASNSVPPASAAVSASE